MSIREANFQDLDRITELGSRSLQDGPYAGIIDDVPAQARKCAQWVMCTGKILLAEEAGRVVGLLGFITADHHFSGQKYAAELMWYVEPEHRGMKAFGESHALNLLKEAERIAKDAGSESFVFTAPNADIARLYERAGYGQLEVTFRKVL